MALTRPKYSSILDTDFKVSCKVATTGSSITLSGGAPNTLDGQNLAVGDRILVRDQSPASENGVYVVSTVGTGSNGTWVRAKDFANSSSVTSGIMIPVTQGTSRGGRIYLLTTPDPITLGSTSLIFTDVTFTPANVSTISNTTAATNTTSGALTVAGGVGISGNIYVGGNANITGTANVTGNISGGNISTAGTLSVTGNANVGNLGTATAIITTANLTTINSGLVQNGNSNIAITANGNITFTSTSNATMVVTGTGANVTGTANVTGDGSIGGNLTVAGNLIVNGTTTTLNTSTLDVEDLNITIAKGAINAAAANGAGLTVDGANATWIYNNTSNTWVSNVGANINGTLNVTGNANVGNIGSDTVISTTANLTTINSGLMQNGNSNVAITANGNVTVAAVGGTRFTATSSGANVTGTLGVSGNANTGNLGTGTIIATTANLTTINSGLMQNGNSNIAITANGNVTVAAVGGTRFTATSSGANVTGTLGVSGNANTGNLGTGTIIATTANLTTINSGLMQNGTSNITVNSSGNVNISVGGNVLTVTSTGANVTGTITSTGDITSNTNLKSVFSSGDEGGEIQLAIPQTNTTISGSVTIDINQNRLRIFESGGTNRGAYIDITAATAGVGSNLLAGGGSGSSISNGTSNVNISTSGGNVTTSVAGSANILVVTSTGANISGTLNATGNANVGNLGTATAIITTGNITTLNATTAVVTTGNITTINSGLMQNGNSNVTITANSNVSVFVNGNATARAVFTSTGANLAGTLNVTGNVTVSNITANGTANLGAVGNVKITGGSANQFLKTDGTGNLSFDAAGVKFTASTVAPTSPNTGDQWYDTAADILFTRINDGSGDLWLDISSTGNTFSSLTATTANIATITGPLTVNNTISATNINRTFALPNTNASATYVRLGTFTAGQTGQHCYIKVVASVGYNAQTAQQLEVNMHFLTSNGTSVDANGFAGWLSYDVTNSSTFSVITKAVGNAAGTSATAYELWVYLPAYTGNGSFYTVEINNSTSTWTHSGTTGADPGAASNTRQIGVNAKYFASNVLPSANATYSLGSTALRFANIWGLASSAQYADLAEKYLADDSYSPGTVVIFGGKAEITVTTQSHDSKVAGVISTEPAYLMNDNEHQGNLWLPVALTGRVPCRVQGPVKKGDVLVSSSTAGVAEKLDKSRYEPGCVIGKSLENHMESTIKTIEVVVGRF